MGAAESTLKRIKQIRADALFGKKKHYNAADRKQRFQSRLNLSVIVINVILGSGLIALLRAENAEFMRWVGAILSLSAATCAALQAYFRFHKASSAHRTIAGRYLDLSKECSNAIADFEDKTLDPAALIKKRDSLTKTLSRINEHAHDYPTSSADYKLAQKGMATGEEAYTEAEMSYGDSLADNS